MATRARPLGGLTSSLVLGLTLPLLAGAATAQLPGQPVRSAEHPQWLKAHGGGHIWYCGAGDPEDFFFRGSRNADGTRNGDQDELIDKLIAQGGNTLYVETVRSHGGDGPADHNPFVNSNKDLGTDQDILDQWEGWIQRCDDAGILVYMFLYDDSSRVWSTGNQVGVDEETYVRKIVDSFEHHPNIIWLVAEESEEAMSESKVRRIADIIADADDHGHIIGNHHHSTTTFKAWAEGTTLEHFSIQLNVPASEAHAGALDGRAKAEATGAGGDAYFCMYTEANFTLNGSDTVRRRYIWDSAMAGVMPMIFGVDIAGSSNQILNWCRDQKDFFEQTTFYETENRDDLAAAGTKWMLANPPFDYIAYTDADDGDLGIAGATPGFYDLLWMDTVTGNQVTQTGVSFGRGTQLLARPAGIGDECAVWAERRWKDLGDALAGSQGLPLLDVSCDLVEGAPFRLELSNAKANEFVYTVVGWSLLDAPFEGGVLVPSVDVIVNGATDGGGNLSLSFPFPAGFPSGGSAYIQCWLRDPAGIAGFASTNAVQGIAP